MESWVERESYSFQMWDAPPPKMASDGCMGPINYTNPLSTGCNEASC